MATIINNPGQGDSDNSGGGAGIIVGVIIAIVLIALFVVYGLPALRNTNSETGTEVNLPENIDVNINEDTGTAN